jgi:hypothetical protein
VKHKTFLVCIAFIVSSLSTLPAAASDWTAEDTAWQASFLALHVVDWGQTRDIAAQPNRYHETNPILGEHPSQARVDRYFAATAILHTAVAYTLPPKWRRAWQYVSIGYQAGFVASNYNIGLRINFK